MNMTGKTGSLQAYEPLFSSSERRRFQRIHIDLFGRVVLASKTEHHCRTEDVSPGGMKLMCMAKPQIGESIVAYIDALGRFSGHVVRVSPEGFSMTINASPHRREMLADKLTWFANRMALNLADQRRHPRIEPIQKFVAMRLGSGEEMIVTIRDISASGVGVESSYRPALGERVSIGKAYATVVRHFDGGFAAQFITPFPANEIDAATRL